MLRLRTNKRSLKDLFGGLAAGLLMLACDGQNLFVGPSLTQQQADRGAPTVIIQSPGDSAVAPLGDSVLVVVQATDDSGLATLRFEGLSFRGDVNLGTDEVVPRFETKVVQLLNPAEDTIVSRWLIATPDTIKELTNIIVTAVDTLGNSAADTLPLTLGGPQVDLEDLVEVVPAGANLPLTVRASDPLGVRLVELFVTGAVQVTISQPVSPVDTLAVLDTVVFIPTGVTGTITVQARAFNTLGVPGNDGPFEVEIIIGGSGDTIPPGAQLTLSSADRMELQDRVTVEVKARDDVLGDGVTQMGYTALAISPTRGDTLIQTESVTFATPRVGNTTQTFGFQVFNADSLALPDTLIFKVTAFVRDQQGNCSTSVGLDSLVTLACGALGGATVSQDNPGDRRTVVIVAGRTVQLPTGGQIMDAVVDTVRRKLYLSNIDRDRIEIFRLQDETFELAAAVGSEPWGITLNRGGDTLLVANSGGTNISMVQLGATNGSSVPFEDPLRRLLTPDVILFDVETTLDEAGRIRYSVFHIPDEEPPGFSDRLQFIAVDSTGRVLYSTKTTLLGDFGTIRKAAVPAGGGDTEVKIFIQHAAMEESADFTGIAHADRVFAVQGAFDDSVQVNDHIPGNLSTLITGIDGTPATAVGQAQAVGSDAIARPGRWSVANLGFHDTTYVSASGDGGWVVFGEGSTDPVGRIIMYEAVQDAISDAIEVDDLMINASETVRGIGLNYDGTLGIARGQDAYFFATDLRLQGRRVLPPGGVGAVLHPLHANAKSLQNTGGVYRPDTHLGFVGTGDRTIVIIDTFHFFRSGRIFIKDVPSGPLRAVLPFPEDNANFTCTSSTVTDQAGNTIGSAVEVFAGGDFNNPHPASGGPTEDSCIVVKLVGITDAGGVVVVDVRKSDLLRDHPTRN